MKIDFTKEILPSKHFRNTWLRKWNWNMNDLRSALMNAEKIDKVGKLKYEAYIKDKRGSKKIIFFYDEEKILIITGSESN